ncbi:MAG: metal-sensing transcriptional repressor [Eubacteriales bacterium]|nr:metal-sensing transcriptional repressor [Eubacteriales bacterium]
MHAHEHAQHAHEHTNAHEHAHTHSHADGGHESESNSKSSSGHPQEDHCGHLHSEEEKKAVINRLSRAIGHLEHVKMMVERGDDCSDVLIQLAAVRSAINNTGKVVLHNHINECIVDAVEHGDMETVNRMEEAIKFFIK